jgi:hypothetical protein
MHASCVCILYFPSQCAAFYSIMGQILRLENHGAATEGCPCSSNHRLCIYSGCGKTPWLLPYGLCPPALFYFIPCLCIVFNLCNQITGVEEDRANKPDRPIPSGISRFKAQSISGVSLCTAVMALGNVWSSISAIKSRVWRKIELISHAERPILSGKFSV